MTCMPDAHGHVCCCCCSATQLRFWLFLQILCGVAIVIFSVWLFVPNQNRVFLSCEDATKDQIYSNDNETACEDESVLCNNSSASCSKSVFTFDPRPKCCKRFNIFAKAALIVSMVGGCAILFLALFGVWANHNKETRPLLRIVTFNSFAAIFAFISSGILVLSVSIGYYSIREDLYALAATGAVSFIVLIASAHTARVTILKSFGESTLRVRRPTDDF